jgi:hypothetical protein
MKKTEAKIRQVGTGKKHYEIQKGNLIVEGRLNQPKQKQKEVSGGILIRTGYTRSTHRHDIEKTPSPECLFCGVSFTTEHILWKCTETTRKKRETGTKKEVCTDKTEILTRLIEYTKKKGSFHRI